MIALNRFLKSDTDLNTHFKTLFKNFFLVFAAFIILFSFAGSVNAITDEASFRTAITDGGTITLTGQTIMLTYADGGSPSTAIVINKDIILTGDGTIQVIGDFRHFSVSSGVTFTLDDKVTLTHINPDEDGGGVYVSHGGTFNMKGGKISGNSYTYSGSDTPASGGGGVLNFGTFTMTGGTISDNTVTGDHSSWPVGAGGGVFNVGTFTLVDGEISKNTAEGATQWQTPGGAGGGVFNIGIFNMEGGKISDNDVNRYGGGVANAGTFTLTGGEINTNAALWDTLNNPLGAGGGVYNNGTFLMNSGMISSNEVD
ncbi:MAG: hypothetical protein LBE57_06220 [Methanosarcinales archaeon]|jgi:hypothetical protein|nr:hypothetical protein [Methanosarcinales archaeon]